MGLHSQNLFNKICGQLFYREREGEFNLDESYK